MYWCFKPVIITINVHDKPVFNMPCLRSYFPVLLEGHWQKQPVNSLSYQLSNWLLDSGSLTKRLKAHSTSFYVKVLGQQIITCSAFDACDSIVAGEQVLAREVVLYCNDQPHVFARTLIPLTSLTGEQQKLSELGEQPLGQIIFNNPSLERKLIQLSEFSRESTVGQLTANLLENSNEFTMLDQLWGRRSLFFIEGKPLVVAEVFLPPALAYT